MAGEPPGFDTKGTARRANRKTLQHIWRGCLSLAGAAIHPLGRFTGSFLSPLRTPQRLDCGLVLVLPGIDGESCLNHNIVRGLADAGIEQAIEVFDWTTGVILFFLYHLRSSRRHVRQAERLAQRIAAYRSSHPHRPVHLVGHSGGAALILLALERLPPEVNVTSVVLLQSAASPDHDMTAALEHSERGIWNVRSRFDAFFLGIGTCIAGTLDGSHEAAAGMVGFRHPLDLSPAARHLYATRLHDVPFQSPMIADFHLGGHLTVTSRPFIANHVAPILKSEGPFFLIESRR